jgi:tryptophan 2,3-dioxygenase
VKNDTSGSDIAGKLPYFDSRTHSRFPCPTQRQKRHEPMTDAARAYDAQPMPPREPGVDVSQNHYWRYHRLDQLLEAKQPVTWSVDEDLFISVHQVCEISFNQMILDMERGLDALKNAFGRPDTLIGNTAEAAYFLKRVIHFWDVVNRTMPILNGMRGFAEFRQAIGPGSGFQSWQFRRIEIMSGIRHVYWAGGTKDAEGKLHVAETEFERRHGADVAGWLEAYREHSLVHYWETLKARAGGDTARLSAHPAAAEFVSLLQKYEAAQKLFHQAHLALAVRQLAIVGVEVGTGGTSFKDYLAKYGKEIAPLFEGMAVVE